MATLHILSHSPFTDSRLTSCLQLLGAQDAVLLTGEAVYALQPDSTPLNTLSALPDSVALFALEEDLQARGLGTPARVTALDYVAFVELCTRFNRVNSWL